ncbi:MAG: MG2 domain-containing protein, partial [Candidatus Aminicenantes bacterium]|nr:MG2 domain-containing protein [Candidatus Aminicenantes bacterium]
LALYDWAQELFDSEDFVQAHELAARGEKAHPLTIGASNCRVLRARITAKEFDLRAESVVRPGLPAKMAVNYRNITGLSFRVIKEDFSALLTGKTGDSLFWMSDEVLRSFVARKPEAQWSADLKPTSDYKQKTALVDIPPLKPGFYRILASFKKEFTPDKNKLQAASFWVSDLGLITAGLEGAINGYVVNNGSGEPSASAEVRFYQWDYTRNYAQRALIMKQAVSTDSLGAFAFSPLESNDQRLVYVRDGKGGELAETSVPSSYPRREAGKTQTMFFTDRSIYRPGQMIFFKGLCLSIDQEDNNYRLLPKQRVRVSFRDVNRQEITSLDLQTNDFGSFDGTLTAPADRLAGEMTISTDNPPGSCDVRVEEYKRPKFQVKLDVPDQEFRLNDTVSIPGEAMAYTGAPVDGASVKFRVLREVRYPWWWSYWYGKSSEGSQEIAHGTLRTDEAGKFKVEFQAKPDASVPASAGPIFTFSVHADVTDTTGETRSDEGFVRLGYASLEAGMSCADWQEAGRPVSVEVTTTTLNNKKVGAKGEIEVYGLRGPEKPVPADLIGEVAVREQEALRAQGSRGFSATPDWRKWPEGSLVAKKEFETSAKEDSRCVLSFGLGKGVYKAKLKTKDKFGTPVESLLYLIVLAPADKKFGVEIPFYAASKKATAEVGQTFEALWGTGYGRSPALVEVFQNNRRLERSWTSADQTQGVIRVPVAENLRGGFTVIVSLIKENRIYRDEMRVSVPWSNKALELKWQTFRSKLKPGQQETWSLKIKGPDAAVRAAEMVATLYDASLDQFTGHGFPGLWSIFRSDRTYFSSNFANRSQELRTFNDSLNPYASFTSLVYTHFPPDITEDYYGYGYPGRVKYSAMRREDGAMPEAAPPPSAPLQEAVMMKADSGVEGGVVGGVLGGVVSGAGQSAAKKPPEPDLSKVTARKNLNETAFFFPHLLSDKDGVVTLEFKMPEALTEWRFLGFAHTKNLESGAIEDKAVTQKELMVQPNPPRFMREGDRLEFTVKVTNMTEKEAAGAVQLTFFDPRTDKALDAALGNASPKHPFTVPAKQSRSFSWPVNVPDGLGIVGYKAVGATGEFSDGEEGMLPVLSRRIFVQESIPLWISDKGSKNFNFENL